MKIAKKLLAAVVAVMIVCSLGVYAFAAEGTISLKAGEIVDGKVKVQAVVVDGADLKAADWVVNYDETALTITGDPANGTGDYTQIMTDIVLMSASNSSLMTAYNSEVPGEVQIGFAFKEVLGVATETVLFTMEFVVADGAENVNINITDKEGNELDSLVLLEKEEEPTEVQPTEVQPTEVQPTEVQPTEVQPTEVQPTEVQPTENATRPIEDDDDKPTNPGKPGNDNDKPGKPNHNHPNTGDNAALAAAAGVVLLAGAAFVVSKKRK